MINPKATRLLSATAGCALLLSLILFVLLQRHYTFDPYTWATPGSESVVSRNSWLARRNLYVATGFLSFVAAVIAGISASVLRRRYRLP